MIELKVKHLTGKDKAIGLISSKNAYSVLIKTRFGIHTFGLKFPIDILILDKNNRVVKVSENLTPNKVFLWAPMYDIVIELPAGEIKKQKIKIGHKINLELHT